VDPLYEKREAFKAAEELLSKGDDAALRYAALELRRCIEAVVYEKLSAYKDRIPPEAARWQPPQALKALLQFEPDAASSKIITQAREAYRGGPTIEPFQFLGHDLRPNVGWLTKNWNKLGSFLHADFPFASHREGLAEQVAFFADVLKDLRPFVVSSFTCTLATTVSVTCSLCGVPSVANADGVRQRGELLCLNADCGARYLARFNDTEVELTLDAPVLECRVCSVSFPLAPKKLIHGATVKCPSCAAEHRLFQEWQYGLATPAAHEQAAAEPSGEAEDGTAKS
jgi:hypothetical protein